MKNTKDYLSRKVSFNTPIVCDMKSCERLYMHIKLFHCGWTCEKDNIRLFYLLNKHHDNHRAQILAPAIVAIYDGTLEKHHQKTLRLNKQQIETKKQQKRELMKIRMMKPSKEKADLMKDLQNNNNDNEQIDDIEEEDNQEEYMYSEEDIDDEDNDDEDNDDGDSDFDPKA